MKLNSVNADDVSDAINHVFLLLRGDMPQTTGSHGL